MVTEQEARDMNTAILAFQQRDQAAQEIQLQQDRVVAQIWFNDTIDLTWHRAQTPRQQFTNSLADRTTLEAIRETRTRMFIIRKEIEIITNRIRMIKVLL